MTFYRSRVSFTIDCNVGSAPNPGIAMRRRDILKICATMPAALAARPVSAQSAPEIITRAAVVIGVDQPQGLLKLHAAASGAKTVADWLENEQHFKVMRFTDDVQPVRAADIFKSVDYFVGLETVQQLLVYFAGHGCVVGFGEFWLLSEAPHNPNEAVSLREMSAQDRNDTRRAK
jgi:hypothetical protein